MFNIAGIVGVPARYGGFESLVENLLPAEKIGVIYCSKKAYQERSENYKGAKLKYISLEANGIQSIPYDVLSILHTLIRTKNDLLILGVSGAIVLPVFKLFSKRRVVTNIDGLEWKRAKWGRFASWFLKLSEKIAVRYSDTVIADNSAIAEHVKETYGVEAEVIAYGGDHAIVGEISNESDQYALALCRIEPENNVELILEAFSKTNKKIKFVGNWDNSSFGKRLKSKFQKHDNIDILDPIYDIQVLFEIRNQCSFYVHGHSAGGTNPSLVEMMHFKKDIVAFDCNYNKASTEGMASFFSNRDELRLLVENSENLCNADDMKEIAERRYTWEIVKQQYLNLFE